MKIKSEKMDSNVIMSLCFLFLGGKKLIFTFQKALLSQKNKQSRIFSIKNRIKDVSEVLFDNKNLP